MILKIGQVNCGNYILEKHIDLKRHIELSQT